MIKIKLELQEGRMMKPRHPLVPELLRLEGYERCLVLNSRGEFYANPRALIDMESSIARPTDWLLFDKYEENVIALYWLKTKTDGAIHVRRSKSGTTALFGAGPLLSYRPVYKVEGPGHVRRVPYRLEPHGPYPLFLLDLLAEDLRPSIKHGRRGPKQS
jgi:hypothetical protein